MNEPNLRLLNELLTLRQAVKKIQQVSWNSSQIEKFIPLEPSELSEKQMKDLIQLYKNFLVDALSILKNVAKEIKNEN